MARHRTGLRNRYRTGRSTYSTNRKGERRDSYGTWTLGRQDKPDVIAGHTSAHGRVPAAAVAGVPSVQG